MQKVTLQRQHFFRHGQAEGTQPGLKAWTNARYRSQRYCLHERGFLALGSFLLLLDTQPRWVNRGDRDRGVGQNLDTFGRNYVGNAEGNIEALQRRDIDL